MLFGKGNRQASQKMASAHQGPVFSSMVREGPTDKMAYYQRPGRGERVKRREPQTGGTSRKGSKYKAS